MNSGPARIIHEGGRRPRYCSLPRWRYWVLGIELAPIFSDDPIVPAWLGWVVAEIAILAESIGSHGVVVTDVELPLSFDRGMVAS